MAVIEAAKVSSKKTSPNRDLYATVCFYYNYNLLEASHLPARDIALLIKTARRLEAKRMSDLTQIAAAPHTVKGRGVKKLSAYFKKEMK